jgi:hypothetical protein
MPEEKNTPESPKPPSDGELKAYELVARHYREDVNLFWTRANFYLLVQGILLSATITAFGSGELGTFRWLGVGLSVIGLVLAVFWLLVMTGSIYWMQQWREQVVRIDKEISRFQPFAAVESIPPPRFRSPSAVTQYLAVLFILIWAALGIGLIAIP